MLLGVADVLHACNDTVCLVHYYTRSALSTIVTGSSFRIAVTGPVQEIKGADVGRDLSIQISFEDLTDIAMAAETHRCTEPA